MSRADPAWDELLGAAREMLANLWRYSYEYRVEDGDEGYDDDKRSDRPHEDRLKRAIAAVADEGRQ